MAHNDGSAQQLHADKITVMTTARAKRLGLGLQQMRTAHRKTLAEVASAMRVDKATVSRWENARQVPSPAAVKNYLISVGVYDPETLDMWADLAEEADSDDPWVIYRDILPATHLDYLGLEAEADLVEAYEATVIPGQVQHPDYAAVVMRSGPKRLTHDEIKARLDARAKRQKRFAKGVAELHVIVDEGALQRHLGDQVMRRQLEHLCEVADWPGVTLRILPLSAGILPVLGSTSILTFRDTDQQFAATELPVGDLVLHSPTDVQAFRECWDALASLALDPDASRRRIEEALDNL